MPPKPDYPDMRIEQDRRNCTKISHTKIPIKISLVMVRENQKYWREA